MEEVLIQRPRFDTDLTDVERFKNIQIVRQDQAEFAVDICAAIKSEIDRNEETRKKYTKPLRELQTLINEDCRAVVEPLKKALGYINEKLLSFSKNQEEPRKENLIKQRMDLLEKLQSEKESLLGDADDVTVQKRIEDIDRNIAKWASREFKIDEAIRTQKATATIMRTWAFKVTDFAALPEEYKTVDEKKLKGVENKGEAKIPGVEFYQKETVAHRGG